METPGDRSDNGDDAA